MNKVKTILPVLLLCYLVYVIITLSFMVLLDHAVLTSWFENRFPEAYLISEFDTTYFTIAHHNFLKVIGPWIIGFLGGFIALIVIFWKDVLRHVGNFIGDLSAAFNFVSRSWRSLTGKQKSILTIGLGAMFGIKVVLFLILPFSVDEAFNFVFFADKGLFLTTTLSNNHVLYNLFSSAWSKTGLDPLYTCRITSILAGMVVHFMIFMLARHFYSFTVGLWTMFLTGVTVWINLLSTIGTTYMVMTCCWLIGLAALIQIIRSRGNAGQYLFIFISTMGMYASKIFIIPLGGLVLTWICFELKIGATRKSTLKIILVTATVATLSLLLYLPMYLWSGGEAVFVKHLASHSLTVHFPLLLETMSVATDVNSKTYLAFVLSILVGILLYKRASNKLKFIFTLAAANVFAVALFILAVHVYPPGRALIYLNSIFFGLLALEISEFIPRWIQKERAVKIFYSVALAAKIVGSLYILQYGWQARITGDIQDRAFYKRLDQLADCIVSTQPKATYEDRQDRYLSFYTRLAAIRRSVPLVFEHNRVQADSCDVCIFYEQPPQVLEGHLQVGSSDFGDIYVKRNRKPAIDPSCFQTK